MSKISRPTTPSRVTLPADPWARAQVQAMDKLRAEKKQLVNALRFLIDYEQDNFAGAPQGEPDWLKRYARLLRKLDRK